MLNNNNLHFKCPRCHGSQYRTSAFDISENNPFGAKCIFCKSNMVAGQMVFQHNNSMNITSAHRAC
ncbi:cold-shock protein [Enterobacteriaceae bacterium 4M9]|nr:cold-shock protein [Enterobacteriaceae bacterium 4M9]